MHGRRVTDRENIVARAGELGCDVTGGASIIVVRARPQHAEEGDWRARVLTVAERGARGVERACLAALAQAGWMRHGRGPNEEAGGRAKRQLVILTPGLRRQRRQANGRRRRARARAGLPGFAVTVARSRHTAEPADLHRAAAEALWPPTWRRRAAHRAVIRGDRRLPAAAPAISEDPTELQGFFDETSHRWSATTSSTRRSWSARSRPS